MEAARMFEVGLSTIYFWLKRGDLPVYKCGPKGAFKVDMEALRLSAESNPEILQKELAVRFEVAPSTICYALKRLKISRKKNNGAIKNAIKKSERFT